MILRARGVKHPSPPSIPPDIENNKRNIKRSSSSKAFNISSNIILSIFLTVVIFLYFSFFRFLRLDVDVRREDQHLLPTKYYRRNLPNEKVIKPTTGIRDGGSSSSMTGRVNSSTTKLDVAAVKDQIKSIRQKFYERYGGETIALDLYSRGIIPLDESSHQRGTKHVSELILSRLTNGQPLSLSFGGYSVTVGRGNYFNQSYPFVLHSVLEPLFSSLGIGLKVHNGAIGGIPSFPYGWCLKNFLGARAAVINWDYSMNEQRSITGLESYIRNAVSSLDETPILIVLDSSKKNKRDLLNEYVQKGVLKDAVFLNGDDYVPKEYLGKGVGLQNWDRWGAPPGAPGQSPWHPKYKRHELMGWLLAIYFLEGIEVAMELLSDTAADKNPNSDPNPNKIKRLIPPVSRLEDDAVTSLFYGTSNDNNWQMNPISCRTSFKPILSGSLKDIVSDGLHEAEEDILQKRSDESYAKGWVLDVGETERTTKIKVMGYGGLGYIDMKEALYAVPQSGTLRLLLPYEGGGVTTTNHRRSANDYFSSLVLCEVSEKRSDKECQMDKDLSIVLGGVSVDNEEGAIVKIKETGAAYLGKQICITVRIPNEAKIQTMQDEGVGLAVDISVTGSVTRKDGACTLSHVIWENKRL